MMLHRHRGFTLVEAIVVLVLTATLAGVMVLFIRRPVQAYVDTSERAELTDVAEIALRRMAREVHGAAPNSIRFSVINGISYLEFIPTKAGGNYLSVSDGAPTSASVVPLDFTNPNLRSFTMVGPMPAPPYNIVNGDSIIIYNLGTGFTNSDAYAASPGNRATVAGVTGSTVNFAEPGNPFSRAGAAGDSPSHRFTVATSPVTFACAGDQAHGQGTLMRYWGYDFQPNQVDPNTVSGVKSALMAGNVYGCQFSVQATANLQSALVGLSIALARPNPAASGNTLETVTLVQQIHVDNTP